MTSKPDSPTGLCVWDLRGHEFADCGNSGVHGLDPCQGRFGWVHSAVQPVKAGPLLGILKQGHNLLMSLTRIDILQVVSQQNVLGPSGYFLIVFICLLAHSKCI